MATSTSTPPPDDDRLLFVEDVQARHRFDDPRAARKLIEDAGGRQRRDGRWFIRADRLRRWENGEGRADDYASTDAVQLDTAPPSEGWWDGDD